jgi:hypothetical protein
MIRKLLVFGIILLFSFLNSTLCASNSKAASNDSVNIKQLILGQIQKAKDNQKNQSASLSNKANLNAGNYDSNENAKSVGLFSRKGKNLSNSIFMRIFILLDIGLSIFVFIFWRRRKLKSAVSEKKQLKTNIMKLREEKVGKKSDALLDSKRKKIRLEPAFQFGADEDLLVRQAKRMSVSVGELQLAARINSFERERR